MVNHGMSKGATDLGRRRHLCSWEELLPSYSEIQSRIVVSVGACSWL